VAVSSIALAFGVGTLLGLVGGYVGSWPDLAIGRLMDVLFSFPTLVLAIAIAAMLGPGLDNAALAIAVVYAPLFSRVARGPVIAERARDHVVAALGLGAGTLRVVFRHILPNVLAPLIVQASVSLAFAILAEASLSYLGLGTQPPDPSWGTMLNEGRTYLETAPWMSVFPGLAIMLAVLGFNLLGDGLRDVLDPQLRGR
jgi:peptide/nickel transport system permease protein